MMTASTLSTALLCVRKTVSCAHIVMYTYVAIYITKKKTRPSVSITYIQFAFISAKKYPAFTIASTTEGD